MDTKKLREILDEIWGTALDAKALMEEPGSTETQYLNKKRYHMDKAVTAIRKLHLRALWNRQ